jgi:hypothetical protein
MTTTRKTTKVDEVVEGSGNVFADLGLELSNVKAFENRCPEQYNAVIECSAFVNWRRLEVGDPSVLALSFRE